jgi:hypothetical protein
MNISQVKEKIFSKKVKRKDDIFDLKIPLISKKMTEKIHFDK